jgi:hypothetical protein
MVVGRAVNGWEEKGWSPADAASAEWREGRAAFLRTLKLEGIATDSGELVNRWDGSAYNPNRSAFWRVVRRLANGLMAPDGGSWASRLVWSNLYKVSPFESHNPSTRLRETQRAAARSLLCTEVQEYHPRWLVFLTGHDWAGPFVEALNGASQGTSGRIVQWAGQVQWEGKQPVRVVVGPHPQGFRGGEDAIVADLLSSLRALDGSG